MRLLSVAEANRSSSQSHQAISRSSRPIPHINVAYAPKLGACRSCPIVPRSLGPCRRSIAGRRWLGARRAAHRAVKKLLAYRGKSCGRRRVRSGINYDFRHVSIIGQRLRACGCPMPRPGDAPQWRRSCPRSYGTAWCSPSLSCCSSSLTAILPQR
jgi:hypothetical protein